MSIQVYNFVVRELEHCIASLEKITPLPKAVSRSEHYVFRHDDKHKVPELAAFLKAVRIVDLLNASLLLLEKGHTQAVYILCRTIDESVEDIIFLSIDPPDENARKRKDEFLEDFFQEEFANPEDPLSSNTRKTVGRKHIRAALGAIQAPVHDPSLQSQVSKSLAQVYSGFVHGAYVFIMELFGGREPRYHINGMANTPPASSCRDEFKNQIYRSIVAITAVAKRYGEGDLVERLNGLAGAFDEALECMGEEEMEVLRKRLNSLPSRRTNNKST